MIGSDQSVLSDQSASSGSAEAELAETVLTETVLAEAALAEAVRAGDRRALARALSRVEMDPGGSLAGRLYRFGGRAHIVGVTGAPGSGKSTLVAAMAAAYRAAGRTVAVLAVDASSPYTGGAVLGDRVRMGALAGDPGVFIRSMASRGQVGGLAAASGAVVRALDAAGFEVVLVETVGAGQTEVEIAAEAHTTVLVLVPGLGDGIQAMKAGIMEIADIYAVNKADLPGADEVASAVLAALGLAERSPGPEDWAVPILKTAARTGEGVAALVAQVDAHAGWLKRSGQWGARERRRIGAEVDRLLVARLLQRVKGRKASGGNGGLRTPEDALLDQLVDRSTDPGAAVDRLLGELLGPATTSRGG